MKTLPKILLGMFLACTLCACSSPVTKDHTYSGCAITGHTYGEWLYDVETHYQICTDCGSTLTKVHDTEPLSPHGVACTVCGYADTEAHTMVNNDHNCKFCDYEQAGPLTFLQGHITTAPETIETTAFIFNIDENIYVPGYLTKVAAPVSQALEQVSGLSFYATDSYLDETVPVNIDRDSIYEQFPESELGQPFATADGNIYIAPGNLFLYDDPTLVHELSHCLQYAQYPTLFPTILAEGFAEYTTYNALIYLQENNPDINYYCGNPNYILYNLQCFDYDALYAQPLTYWFDNPFPYAMNDNYAIGFRFMAYLHAVYGDYTLWLKEFSSIYPEPLESQFVSSEDCILVLKAAYGDDVLDNFYPWLQENENLFVWEPFIPQTDIAETAIFDLTATDALTIYPRFTAEGNSILGVSPGFGIKYLNLYFDLNEARKYLSEYKGRTDTTLTMLFDMPTTVNFYDENGTLLRQETGVQFILEENVSYIKLVGEGITNFSIDNL